jgi:hypothetical protein
MIWPMPVYIFITDRVAALLTELNVTGLDLVPIQSIPIDDNGFTPGRLSFSMPPGRAEEIGKPLGID